MDAASATGASRYVQESIAFLYADGGDRLLDESAALATTGTTNAALVAEAEAARFAEHGGAGVALRFGQFYGFDSGHTVKAIEAVRAGLPVELGPESAYRSSVTTDDAASAVVAALDAPSGVYNVVDDQPLPRAEYVAALARRGRCADPGRAVGDPREAAGVRGPVAVPACLEQALQGGHRVAAASAERTGGLGTTSSPSGAPTRRPPPWDPGRSSPEPVLRS